MTVLVANQLGRWYGQVVGLNELTVDVGAGTTGLIGPNGAGKSTFLKLIAGEIKPSRGSIRVLGENPFANRALYARIGFCPQQDALYDDMSAFALVRLLLTLSGVRKSEAGDRADAALRRLHLEQDMHRPVGTFSKGMRQRVKIAQAIAHGPELLVLDEPLSGLDPVSRRDVLALLRELGGDGVHLLLSSHVLHEVESLTEDILLLHRGRLLAQGSVSDIRLLLSRHPRRIELRATRARQLAQDMIGCDEITSVRLQDDGVVMIETRDLERFYSRMTEFGADRRYGVRSLESADASLEAIFDYLVT